MKITIHIMLFLIAINTVHSQNLNKVLDYRDFVCGEYSEYYGNCSINVPPNDPYNISQTRYVHVEKSLTSLDSIIIIDSSLYYTSNFKSYAKLNTDSTFFVAGWYYGNFKKQDTLTRTYIIPGPTYCYGLSKRVSTTVGLQKLNLNKTIDIYPNPASGKMTIVFNDRYLPYQLKGLICDVNGKEVLNFEFPVNSHTFVVDVSTLKAGLYLVKALDFDRIYSKKLLIINE